MTADNDVILTEDVDPATTSRVTVAEPFQVAYAGSVFRPGDTPEVPQALAQAWIRDGWVVADEPGK